MIQWVHSLVLLSLLGFSTSPPSQASRLLFTLYVPLSSAFQNKELTKEGFHDHHACEFTIPDTESFCMEEY